MSLLKSKKQKQAVLISFPPLKITFGLHMTLCTTQVFPHTLVFKLVYKEVMLLFFSLDKTQSQTLGLPKTD